MKKIKTNLIVCYLFLDEIKEVSLVFNISRSNVQSNTCIYKF